MLKSGAASCTDDHPCKHYDPCARCQAQLYLTPDDWLLIRFYRMVADQADGTTGAPRHDRYEATARREGLPDDLIPWLVSGAAMLHRLVTKQDEVEWIKECGKPYRYIGPEDVCDGYSG